MRHWLFSERGRTYLLEEYVAKERSTYDVAAAHDTYANLVRRALLHHNIRPRDKSKAQAAALASGRHSHPSRGRKRTDPEPKE